VAGVVGGFQRVGVSLDGSTVVFEVTDDTAVVHLGAARLPPDQKGMFLVHADGTGLRRLGPASRDPSFRTSPDLTHTYIFNVALAVSIPFSPDGRRIAFTDLASEPGREINPQVFVLDLNTGERTQVTHLPYVGLPDSSSTFLTAYPSFMDKDTILFFTYTDPDGSNRAHDLIGVTVRIDGSRLKPVPFPPHVAGVGGRVLPIFGVAHLATNLLTLSVPGTPVNYPYPDPPQPSEVFAQDGKNVLQLTNFHRSDTGNLFLNVTGTRAFFRSSADPLEMNPYGQCQIFSIHPFGSGLRQVTHFNPGEPVPQPGCGVNIRPGCQLGGALAVQDRVTKAVIIDSGCDPLGANPFGSQAFAMRPDGTGFRQLTDTTGFTTNPDGSIRSQLPGLFAYSARSD
jgi:hypothetical protein